MNELTGSSVFRAASRADAKAAPMTAATGESAATGGVSSMEQGMVFATANGLPPAQGLYDSRNEHDACGVGFVANMHNAKSHELVRMGLQILLNLDHRGAVGADPKAGDGCGMLMQIPHRLFAEEAARLGFACPSRASMRSARCSCRATPRRARPSSGFLSDVVAEEGQVVLGWRDVPVDPSRCSARRQAGRARPSARSSSRRGADNARPGRLRAQAVPDPQDVSNAVYALHDRRCRAGIRSRCPRAPSSTRACCSPRSSAIISRTCAISASRRRRPRAPAILDQHLPVVAAGPSLSHGRA